MGASHQIQPPHTAGTGDRVRNPAGESLVGTEPETGRSGEATGPHHAHCLPLEGGGELRICAVHGRLEVLARLGKGRVFQTTPLSAERGDTLARRISEIADIARAQRQAKGA